MKFLKEWVYVSKSREEIQDMIEGVLKNMKDLTTMHLKRLLKNAQYLFPKDFEDVNPHFIRDHLLDSFKERTATGEKVDSLASSLQYPPN